VSDQVLTRDGPVAVPMDYQVPQGGELLPLTVRATMDGTNAATGFYATVQIIAPSGRVMASAISATIAAGASADVSWFPWRRGITAAAPAPSPNPLGTLWAWWDFADTSTITLDGSGKINSIADKTGNGHNAVQATASQRPSESTLNGLNCGLFNSAAQTMLVTTGWPTLLSQPFTVAVVWTQTIASSVNYQPGPIGGTPSPPPAILFDNFNNTSLVMQQGAGSILVAKAAPYTQQQATLTFNGASSTFRVNGVSTAGTVDGDTMTNFALGTSHNPSDVTIVQEMDGKLGEVLVYEGALSASQLSAVESYLKTKWATP